MGRIDNVIRKMAREEMSDKELRFEKKLIRFLKKTCVLMMLISIFAGIINLYINEGHSEKIKELQQEVINAEKERKDYYNKISNQLALIEENERMKLQVRTLDTYFERKNAGVLKWTGDKFVTIGKLYWIDPFRMASMSMLESRGTSEAALKQNNVCGINWTDEELSILKKKGFRPDIYNVKIYGSVDECIMAQGFKLKTLYKDYWGLKTLSEIQTRWAPEDDHREGMDGMSNATWTKNTVAIYRELEAVYKELSGEDYDNSMY
jgi:hypothetical protein